MPTALRCCYMGDVVLSARNEASRCFGSLLGFPVGPGGLLPLFGATNVKVKRWRRRSDVFAPPKCHVVDSIGVASPAPSSYQIGGELASFSVAVGLGRVYASGGGSQTPAGKHLGTCVPGEKYVGPIVSSRMSWSAKNVVTVRGEPALQQASA